MSYRSKKIVGFARSALSHFAVSDGDVLDRDKPLSDQYLDKMQAEIEAKLGSTAEREPVSQPGW